MQTEYLWRYRTLPRFQAAARDTLDVEATAHKSNFLRRIWGSHKSDSQQFVTLYSLPIEGSNRSRSARRGQSEALTGQNREEGWNTFSRYNVQWKMFLTEYRVWHLFLLSYNLQAYIQIKTELCYSESRDSAVGIATSYG
jgi:hypothetical protein